MTVDRHDVYTVCFSIAMTFFTSLTFIPLASVFSYIFLLDCFFIPFATVSINMLVRRLVICAISMTKVYDVFTGFTKRIAHLA